MQQLLRSTNAYRAFSEGERAHAVLVVFPDEEYLRDLLLECAKAFFGAADGSREAMLIGEEHFPDCIILPERGGKLTAELGVRILDESALRPVEGTKKLFVLDAFHTVTPLVQNKLLKILEEPPEGVTFLLGAVSEYPVLPTVRSRTRQITVPPFSEGQIEGALRRMGGKEGVRQAAAASGGLLSSAKLLMAGGGEEFRRAERFLRGEDTETLCRGLVDRTQAKPFFAAVKLLLRDAAFYAAGSGQYIASLGGAAERLAPLYPAGAAVAGIALTEEAEHQMGFNANFQQCALALAIGLKKERERWQTSLL